MNRLAVAGGLLALALGSVAAADPDPAVKELDGTYAVVALSKGGVDAPEDFWKDMTLTIAGDELTFRIKDKAFPAKITRLDPKAKPAAIDIAPADGPEKGKTFKGVYSYKKGELTLAFAEKGDRPKDFSGENDAVVMRLRKLAKKVPADDRR